MSDMCITRDNIFDLSALKLSEWFNIFFMALICWKCDDISVAKTMSITRDLNSLLGFKLVSPRAFRLVLVSVCLVVVRPLKGKKALILSSWTRGKHASGSQQEARGCPRPNG